MLRQPSCALLSLAILWPGSVWAQVVRFETTAGSFDLVLNPTGNPLLQGHVDNMLQYVVSGRYDGMVVNRAAEGFVLQTGLYTVASPTVPATVDGFIGIAPFDPVAGVPAGLIDGLSNTRGMVGWGINGDEFGPDPNSGTSSFYVNLTSNRYLDTQFTVFAQVVDLAPIDAIMDLPQINLTADPDFGEPFDLQFSDVPLLPNGDLVIVSRAFAVENIMDLPGDYNRNGEVDSADYVLWRRSRSTGTIGAGLAADGDSDGVVDIDDYDIWARHFGDSSSSISILLDRGGSSVPEPSTHVMAGLLLCGWLSGRLRQRSRRQCSKN